METIVKAKDQQAAEANKNASILLKELDLEKVCIQLTFVRIFIIVTTICSMMYQVLLKFYHSLVKKAKSRLWLQSERRERRSARKRKKNRRGSWRKRRLKGKRCSVICKIRRRILQTVRSTFCLYPDIVENALDLFKVFYKRNCDLL